MGGIKGLRLPPGQGDFFKGEKPTPATPNRLHRSERRPFPQKTFPRKRESARRKGEKNRQPEETARRLSVEGRSSSISFSGIATEPAKLISGSRHTPQRTPHAPKSKQRSVGLRRQGQFQTLPLWSVSLFSFLGASLGAGAIGDDDFFSPPPPTETGIQTDTHPPFPGHIADL